MTRLGIVAEVALYREGLAAALARRPDWDVVAVARGAEECLAAVRELEEPPELVVVDVGERRRPGELRRLVTELPSTRVVAVTVPESAADVIACAEEGVAGFVTRNAGLEDLVAALEGVLRGDVVCSPAMAAALLRRVGVLALAGAPPPAPLLTQRETEVAGLIDEGLSNKQIAQRLSIELSTVKNHVHSILAKLDVERRGQAVARLRSLDPF